MSVFNKVVSRVRDFFLEPEAPTPAPASKPAPKGSVEKSDSFEWEPPSEKRRPQNEAAARPLAPRPSENSAADASSPSRQAPFSPRNFSTAELQRSSVLDIV